MLLDLHIVVNICPFVLKPSLPFSLADKSFDLAFFTAICTTLFTYGFAVSQKLVRAVICVSPRGEAPGVRLIKSLVIREMHGLEGDLAFQSRNYYVADSVAAWDAFWRDRKLTQ